MSRTGSGRRYRALGTAQRAPFGRAAQRGHPIDVEARAMNERRSLLTTAGTLAAVLFGAGLAAVFLLPGGGQVTEDQFTSFYDSSSRPATALLLYLALVAGSGRLACLSRGL